MEYYVPGETYTFRSLDGNQTKVISVTFDAAGHAAVSISSEGVADDDKPSLYLFAPADEYTHDVDSDAISITGDLSKYWFIYFNDPEVIYDSAAPTGGSLTVSCSCKTGSGTCSVNWKTGPGSTLCANCSPDGSACEDCNEPKWSGSSAVNVGTTSVLIKAESIDLA